MTTSITYGELSTYVYVDGVEFMYGKHMSFPSQCAAMLLAVERINTDITPPSDLVDELMNHSHVIRLHRRIILLVMQYNELIHNVCFAGRDNVLHGTVVNGTIVYEVYVQ